jgi:hypothetical protein
MKHVLTLLLALGAGIASAAPVAYNGNYYEYIDGATDWTTASAAAAASTFNGLTGQLASIADAAENTFVSNLAGNGYADALVGLQLTGGNWGWSDGSAFSYTSWAANEPNNYGGNEVVGITNSGSAGLWNDVSTAYSASGYVIEYSATATAAVPEPETYALLLAGLGIVGTMARRRKPSTDSE